MVIMSLCGFEFDSEEGVVVYVFSVVRVLRGDFLLVVIMVVGGVSFLLVLSCFGSKVVS